jgi:predicted Fe-Mo cluster-binding NifX family protein
MLTIDEYETVRLIDLEKLTHEQCARRMDISRTTVTELYESARYKLADSIVSGKRLQITGGHYRICDGVNSGCWKNCAKRAQASKVFPQREKGGNRMKIAVTYENGNVFQHFGHTEQFKLYTVENGKITESRITGVNGNGHGALAGFLQSNDVDTLICGGIGAGAQNALQAAGIKLYGGVTGSTDDAVRALLDGTLVYDPDVHCDHHDHDHQDDGHHCGDHGCHGSHGCHGDA